MQNSKDFNFRYDYGHYALIDYKVKSANVAYEEKYLLEQIESSGFTVEKFVKGYWCGRKKEFNYAFQDVLVLRKL